MKLIECPQCGKVFVFNKFSIYKWVINGILVFYCGYNCWRKNETKADNYNKRRIHRHGG